MIFDKKIVSYVLVLSWFCLLTFSLFKDNFSTLNDWFKIELYKEIEIDDDR